MAPVLAIHIETKWRIEIPRPMNSDQNRFTAALANCGLMSKQAANAWRSRSPGLALSL